MEFNKLSDFNKRRKEIHYKSEENEDFLIHVNKVLQEDESSYYQDIESGYPFLFVYGLPRSGTTIMTQLLIAAFDVGYINNFMARFWLAPVTGIKLSKIIHGDNKNISFRSDYASTYGINDIHEFGYFWRYWLKKDNIEGHINREEIEKHIDWVGLRKVLLNMQSIFDKPMCMKNIFGSFHIEKIIKHIPNALFIEIQRDHADTAVSILEARKKFYDDLNLWWSIIPREYYLLKDLPYMNQIAGQVSFLSAMYDEQFDKIGNKNILRFNYQDLCERPTSIVKRVKAHLWEHFGYDIKIESIPPSFPFKSYDNKKKSEFKKLLNKYRK